MCACAGLRMCVHACMWTCAFSHLQAVGAFHVCICAFGGPMALLPGVMAVASPFISFICRAGIGVLCLQGNSLHP